MSDSLEKQLISALATSWNEVAPNVLGSASTLSLLASREVSGDGMSSALAVAMTWSNAFAAPVSGNMNGVLICLFKTEDGDQIDRLIKQPSDGSPRPGARSLVDGVLAGMSDSLSEPVTFGPTTYINLALNEARLAKIVGQSAHIGTFSLEVGSEITSQALMLYAPEGTLEDAPKPEPTKNVAEAVASKEPSAAAQPTRRQASSRTPQVAPRNIERLLDVELDVIVRFGITSLPLRDVVRMGIGTMIELNRAVDEPVELLVNGRQLARGEVVVVDGYYGVRITEIGPPAERASAII